MSAYSEIQSLLEVALAKDAAIPMGVQMKLLKFSKAAVDPLVAEEAVQAGGVGLMIKVIKRADQNQTTAMKTLVALLSRPEGLQTLEQQRHEMLALLFENLHSSLPAVVALSLGLIQILVNYYDDSYALVAEVSKDSSVAHGDVQYAPLLDKLTRGILSEVKPAILVLCGLVEKSVTAAETDSLLDYLRRAHILEALTKAEQQIPESREDLQNDVRRLRSLVTAEGDAGKTLEKTHWQSDRLAESMFKQNSPGLVSKVTALTGLAELAGISSSEGMMMQALTQHLKQMEEKLNAMNKDQQEEMNRAIVKQQAAMEAQLAEQKALYEQKLFALQNDTKVEQTDKNYAALVLQIEELKSNQTTLMQEYNKNQADITEQHYLRQHKQLWLFYQVIQMKLNELFLGYKVLSSGLVEQTQTGSKTEKGIQTVITIAGDLIPFPGASTVAGVITSTLRYYKSRQTEKKAEYATNTAVSVGNMEQISEYCARILALRYESQIRALENHGARLLGECAVRRMMEAMRAGSLNVFDNTVDNKAISKQLVDVIIQVEKKQGILSMKHKSIPTLPGTSLNWHEQAIFKKPGIRTIEGEFFHCPPETDVAAYGYRIGTVEEAKALHYLKCRVREHSSLDLSVAHHLSFYALPTGSFSQSFTCLNPLSSSSACFFSASSSPPSTPVRASLPPPPYKSPSPSSPLLKISSNEGAPASASEVEELRKTVADLQKRLVQMEAMMLLMSAKVFPK